MTTSEALVSSVIIVTNMAVTLFMFLIGGIPRIADHLRDATPVWNKTVWTLLAGEMSLLTFALSLPFLAPSRLRTFL